MLDRPLVVTPGCEARAEAERALGCRADGFGLLVEGDRLVARDADPLQLAEAEQRVHERGVCLQRRLVFGLGVGTLFLRLERLGHELVDARRLRRQRVEGLERGAREVA